MTEIREYVEITDLRVCVCGEFVFKLKKAKMNIGDKFLDILDVAGSHTYFVLDNIDYFQFTEVMK